MSWATAVPPPRTANHTANSIFKMPFIRSLPSNALHFVHLPRPASHLGVVFPSVGTEPGCQQVVARSSPPPCVGVFLPAFSFLPTLSGVFRTDSLVSAICVPLRKTSLIVRRLARRRPGPRPVMHRAGGFAFQELARARHHVPCSPSLIRMGSGMRRTHLAPSGVKCLAKHLSHIDHVDGYHHTMCSIRRDHDPVSQILFCVGGAMIFGRTIAYYKCTGHGVRIHSRLRPRQHPEVPPPDDDSDPGWCAPVRTRSLDRAAIPRLLVPPGSDKKEIP